MSAIRSSCVCRAVILLCSIVLLVSYVFSDFVSADIPLAVGLVNNSMVMPSPTKLVDEGTTFDGVASIELWRNPSPLVG